MRRLSRLLWCALVACGLSEAAFAQKGPEVGYVFPAGGQAGTTIDVRLGGYDWTPDLQYFVHDPRVTLTVAEPPGPQKILPPPYWFGPKGRLAPHKIPREVSAKLTLPADGLGPVEWQVANASGASTVATFLIGPYTEIVEDEYRREPQTVPALPLTINGRVRKVEEVDRYRFSVDKPGLITCSLFTRRLGTKLSGALTIDDDQQRRIVDVADTEGRDLAVTFRAEPGRTYDLALHDIDFGGDWSFVYRLELAPRPRVVATVPATLKRGIATEVELLGYGIATGAPVLESVTRSITPPADPGRKDFTYLLETAFGLPAPITIALSDLPETRDAAAALPAAITSRLAQKTEEDKFTWAAKMGEVWDIEAQAQKIGSPLDLVFAVLDPTGKEVARGDDVPGSVDAAVSFKIPADGMYTIAVSDVSGKAGTPTALYRLTVVPSGPDPAPTADFTIEAPRFHTVTVGAKAELAIKAVRTRGQAGDIAIAVQGLPPGATVPADLKIPAGMSDLKIPIELTAEASSFAVPIRVSGTGMVAGAAATRTSAPILFTPLLKPRAKVEPVDKDGGRNVHRGTTFPSDVIITRMEGFTGPVLLYPAAMQSYQVQGVDGPEMLVPPEVTRTQYPCYMPEWLELDRTSRMILVAVAQVPDGQGKVRHLVTPIDGRITMSMEGALLKVQHEPAELSIAPGASIEVPVKISRSPKLQLPVQLEVVPPEGFEGLFVAEPVTVPAELGEATIRVDTAANPKLRGPMTFTIRGTAIQPPNLPVISQTDVAVEFPKP